MALYLVMGASKFSGPRFFLFFFYRHTLSAFLFYCFFFPSQMYLQGLIIKLNAVIFGGDLFYLAQENNKWHSLVGFTLGVAIFFFVPNGSCLILKWNSSVTSIHYFMFMHVECFILLNANPLFDLNGWPFETFWEAPSFVLRAPWHSWIFHFLMRLLPVITRLCSPRTYYYRRYTLCLRHTHSYTLHLSYVPAFWFAHLPTHTHANPGRLFIY